MFKRLTITAAIALVSSNLALADMTAPYVGGSIGMKNISAVSSLYSDSRGGYGNVFAGYGSTFGRYYIGGEAFTDFGTIGAQSSTLKSSYTIGASAIPGIMINDSTMLFGRVGFADSRFENLETSSLGGQLGIGLQTNVAANWDVRGEYVYTGYRSVSNVGSPKSDQFDLGALYKFG